jgi:hypothetical protein
MENAVEKINTNDKIALTQNSSENIKNLIYTIRGKQVMLDSDVAILYHYETKKINQTVKRNINRFPEKFCFRLTKDEFEFMWSQIVTTSKLKDNKYRSAKYLPYVFTEQGIAMLSGLLKNEIAVQISINIMDAFIEMRKFLLSNGQVFDRLSNVEYKLLEQNKVLTEHEEKFEKVFDELQKNEKEEFKQKIFFDGQIYDAYSLIIDIIKRAKNKILIIDNYILDIQKFNKQYPTLKIAYTNKFHDRFIVIDNKELYHCGASLKDLGKKCFAISKIEDIEYIEKISFVEEVKTQ